MDLRDQTIARYGKNVLRGILMGGADIVPGVSGGTVALILGIYERLVTAISHVDLELLGLVRKRQWARAAGHIDLLFLLSLGTGILIGFVIMTTLMHYLLSTEETRALTLAMFFGLIMASGLVVALMIHVQSNRELLLAGLMGVAGAAFAWWLAGLTTANAADPHLAFIFLSAMVAICAMILPGISGAMVLLILGVYVYLTEIPGNILRGRDVVHSLVTVLVFATGCAIGLIAFSKILRWLLARYHSVTMGLLCGFMFGSLRKLWPFQQDVTPHIEEIKFKTFRLMLPTEIDGHVLAIISVILLSSAAVWIVDWYTYGHIRRLCRKPGPASPRLR